MKYHNIELTKREAEVVKFLQTGSNNFWDAYYSYEHRKKRMDRPTLTTATWFNHTLKSLHNKGLFLQIPFVCKYNKIGSLFMWMNPGINASKSSFQAITLQDAYVELQLEKQKIL